MSDTSHCYTCRVPQPTVSAILLEIIVCSDSTRGTHGLHVLGNRYLSELHKCLLLLHAFCVRRGDRKYHGIIEMLLEGDLQRSLIQSPTQSGAVPKTRYGQPGLCLPKSQIPPKMVIPQALSSVVFLMSILKVPNHSLWLLPLFTPSIMTKKSLALLCL